MSITLFDVKTESLRIMIAEGRYDTASPVRSASSNNHGSIDYLIFTRLQEKIGLIKVRSRRLSSILFFNSL